MRVTKTVYYVPHQNIKRGNKVKVQLYRKYLFVIQPKTILHNEFNLVFELLMYCNNMHFMINKSVENKGTANYKLN